VAAPAIARAAIATAWAFFIADSRMMDVRMADRPGLQSMRPCNCVHSLPVRARRARAADKFAPAISNLANEIAAVPATVPSPLRCRYVMWRRSPPPPDLLGFFEMSRKRSRASVGAKLKKARERCGLSLRQIADSTKISLLVLQGLERDEIAHLPGGVLGRGYVRSFATSVKLNPELIVAEFVAQFPESSVTDGYPPAERVAADKVAEVATAGKATKIRLNESGSWTRIAAVVVLGIVLAGVMTFAAPKRWAQWDVLRNWATSVPVNPIGDYMSAEAPLGTLEARPITPRPSAGRLTLPSPLVPPPAIGAPTASPVPVATASKSEPASRSEPASKSEPMAPADAAAASPIANEPLKMTLSASAPSWVIAWVDGKKTINRLLDVDERETLEATRELIVTAGNGGAIAMTLNEAVTRTLGRAGKTVTVKVNHANLPKFLGRDESASIRLAQ
jgi:cytoskeleton protein RodZ